MPTEADFTIEVSVELDGPPPMWAELTQEEYESLCESLVAETVELYI